MHIVVCAVTRNVSICVKTLHTLLNINKICTHFNHSVEINFIKDDFNKSDAFLKNSKHCDRLIWIEYGYQIDEESLARLIGKFPQNYNCMVLPAVVEGINWDSFKKKIRGNSQEPVSQMGLDFDTAVGTPCIAGDEFLRPVLTTDPKCWAIEAKSVLKALKDQKGEGIKLPPKFFDKIRDRAKVCAFTKAKVTATYSHECIGNILESAGIRVG